MYALDPQSARKADASGSTINELGKYVGVFTQAVDITAGTGTKGISFVFKSDAGQRAKLSLYTMKKDGEKIMGFQVLSAIMTCLQLRGIEPKRGQYLQWNNETREEEAKVGDLFPDICNKPIGLLLETEDYEGQDGKLRTRMVLRAAFQAKTELTASEILDKKTVPERLGFMVSSLRHRPLKKQHTGNRPAAQSQGGSGFDDMDDDIPF